MISLYIDPGTGSILISSLIALVAVGFYMIKGFVYRKFNIGDSANLQLDITRTYSLVFYSEGGQYWNVFKPVLEELNARGIAATYLSSNENDPGLVAELENIEKLFVGSGRQLYYFMNHLKADMVVMTTPGLDVLQIKRSKGVKQYCHITHSAGGADTYKAFGLDYYDSVLVGGDGDHDFIRELERKRGSQPKDIEVIGCTYLDVQRQRLKEVSAEQPLFKDERPTILLSPTWGEHGLLYKYGDTLLRTLESIDAYNVIVRPHPQSFISEKEIMERLISTFPDNEHRLWDREPDGLKSMAQSDLMISDFSGIIFDFLFLFGKPVLSLHKQIELRGRDAIDLDEEPWGIRMLTSMGNVLEEKDLERLPEIIEQNLDTRNEFVKDLHEARLGMDKYPGESGRRGADFIQMKLQELQLLGQPAPTVEASDECQGIPNSIAGKLVYAFQHMMQPNTWFQFFLTIFIFTIYVVIGAKTLPFGGFNYRFFNKGLPFVELALVGVFIVWIILLWTRGKGTVQFSRKRDSFDPKNFLVMFLPMTPIVQYIIANNDILTFGDGLTIFFLFLVGATLLTVLISWMLSPLVWQGLTLTVTLGLVFYVLNTANMKSMLKGDNLLEVLNFIVVFAVIFLLYGLNKKSLQVFAVIFFVVNIGVAVAQSGIFAGSSVDSDTIQTVSQTDLGSGLHSYLAEKEPIRTPDVYLLVYESYGNQETLGFYGIDNSRQMEYLLDSGFAIYDGTYSVGAPSVGSISHMLHMERLPQIDTRFMRSIVAQEATALKLFSELGYRNNAVMKDDYMIRASLPTAYDYFFPNPSDPNLSISSVQIITTAILAGEFRFDADFSKVTYNTYLQEKRNFLSSVSETPRFLYTHNDFPGHTPNTEVLRANETELFYDRLLIANEEMRSDLSSIVSENQDAIIILAGDHGPYLTKNGTDLDTYPIREIDRYDVQDRFGTLLAIRWPESEYADKFDIQLLQDVFPAVFAYLYNDDQLYDDMRMERETFFNAVTGGVVVRDGIVEGGADDGTPLFDTMQVRFRKDR